MAMIDNLLVIIGSAKAGTTSAMHWLGQHPRICAGINKEPKYFTDFQDRNWTGPGGGSHAASQITTLQAYEENFPRLAPDCWAVEASADYIWNGAAAARLKEFSKTRRVKLISFVRDPVDRAVSEYNHTLRLKWQEVSFSESVQKEEERRAAGYHPLFYHKRRSEIHADLINWIDLFEHDILILDFAILSDPANFFRTVLGFLDLPVRIPDDLSIRNESYLPRNKASKAVLESAGVRRLARSMFPQSVRHAVWRGLLRNANQIETVKSNEIAEFALLMRDEIRLCLSDPRIPTDNWSVTATDPAQPQSPS